MQNKSLDRLYIGNRSAGLTRAYIQFAAMPTIPTGATITAATMTLHFTSGTSTAANASAYQVTGGEWASGEIQWSNKPAADVLLQENISHNNVTGYTFSCLTAVQHWYDGDTTGQNENYGIMLRYYDETTDDYNAVYSADHTDETKRPQLVISYQPANTSLDVDVGDTLSLSVSGATGTVTWTSFDTAVATINASGVVTGVKIGIATITASVGNTVYMTFKVHVTVADSVYRIRNNAGLFLGTYGGMTENTAVKLLSYAASGVAQVRQLWKVTYLDNGYYSIRPLHKMDMGLHANGFTGSSVDIVSIGTSDTLSAVNSLNRWSISTSLDGEGCYLNHVGTSSLGLKADGTIPSAGMDLTIAQNSGEDVFEWSFLEVTDPPCRPLLYEISTNKFIDYTCSRYISVGSARTLAELDLSVYSYSENSTESVTWSCKSGSDHLFLNTSTGSISARTPGTALLTAANSYGSIDLYVTITGTSATNFTFINHYDVSFMEDPELVGYIDDSVNFVNQAFQRQFGITFSSSTVPYYRSAAITDECPLDYWTSCHEEGGCEGLCNTSHHKNIYRISDHFYSSTIPEGHIAVFWTDREFDTYCVDGRYLLSVSRNGAVYAIVWKHRPVIHMTTIDDNQGNRMYCMATNLAHEFVHTLGMDDKDDSIHSEVNWNCIMEPYSDDEEALGQFFEDVSEGRKNLFCASCEAEIRTLLFGSD